MPENSNLFAGWSPKHTRLRYQVVVSCLGLLLISTQEIKTFKVPGFFEFNEVPNYTILWWALFVFSIFSLLSFHYQTKLEKSVSNLSGDRILEELKLLLETRSNRLDEGLPTFDPNLFGKAIWENLAQRDNTVNEFNGEKFRENKDMISRVFGEISIFDENAVDILAFWKSDFDALMPDLTAISGEYMMELRRMDSIISRSDVAYQRFSEAWSFFRVVVPPSLDVNEKLDKPVDGQEFGHSLNQVEKYLELIRSSVLIFIKFGNDVRTGAAMYNNFQRINSRMLAYKIPFWFSVSLICLSVVASCWNIYLFMESS